MRSAISGIVLLLALSPGARAQTAAESTAQTATTSFCYHARPRPACTSFVITNFGTYLLLAAPSGGPIPGLGPLRGIADWGVMANISALDAIGAHVARR